MLDFYLRMEIQSTSTEGRLTYLKFSKEDNDDECSHDNRVHGSDKAYVNGHELQFQRPRRLALVTNWSELASGMGFERENSNKADSSYCEAIQPISSSSDGNRPPESDNLMITEARNIKNGDCSRDFEINGAICNRKRFKNGNGCIEELALSKTDREGEMCSMKNHRQIRPKTSNGHENCNGNISHKVNTDKAAFLADKLSDRFSSNRKFRTEKNSLVKTSVSGNLSSTKNSAMNDLLINRNDEIGDFLSHQKSVVDNALVNQESLVENCSSNRSFSLNNCRSRRRSSADYISDDNAINRHWSEDTHMAEVVTKTIPKTLNGLNKDSDTGLGDVNLDTRQTERYSSTQLTSKDSASCPAGNYSDTRLCNGELNICPVRKDPVTCSISEGSGNCLAKRESDVRTADEDSVNADNTTEIRNNTEKINDDESTNKHQDNDVDNVESPSESGCSCKWINCNEKLKTAFDLKTHVKECHVKTMAASDLFFCFWNGCKVYNKPSSSYNWLTKHVNTHVGIRPFQCVIEPCDLSFASQNALVRHVQSHFNERSKYYKKTKNNSQKRTGTPTRNKPSTPEESGSASESSSKQDARKKKFKLFTRRRIQGCRGRDDDEFDRVTMDYIKHKLTVIDNTSNGCGFNGVRFQCKPKILGRRVGSDGQAEFLTKFTNCRSHIEWLPKDNLPETESIELPISIIPDEQQQHIYNRILGHGRKRRKRKGR